MHEKLEGSLELCMCYLLIHMIHEDKLFPLAYLNARTVSINYGHSKVKSKPSQIAPLMMVTSNSLVSVWDIMFALYTTYMYYQLHRCGVWDYFSLSLL